MQSIYPELALCGNKIVCAKTEIVFLPISEVSEGTVSLLNIINIWLGVGRGFQIPNLLGSFSSLLGQIEPSTPVS